MKNNKIRLHKLITLRIKSNNLEYTRHDIQQNIEKYGAKVNGIVIYNRLQWVLPFDNIEFGHWPVRDHGNLLDIKIVFENSELIVIHKPIGVIVEPGAGHENHNIKTFLEERYGHSLYLVNRLDKHTQGLMIIATSLEHQTYFQNQFRERTVQKQYLSIASGSITSRIEVIGYQARNKQNPIIQEFFAHEKDALNYAGVARKSISEFEPIAFCEETNETIIKVTIKTGRMHQIRLHAETIGHPLAYEKLYTRVRGYTSMIDHILSVPVITTDTITKIREKVFGNSLYCLLSNYICIKTSDGPQTFRIVDDHMLEQLIRAN